MTNSKVLILAIVFLIAGSAVVLSLPKQSLPVSPQNPLATPTVVPNNAFSNLTLRSLTALLFFPSATPAPTSSQPQPTDTPVPNAPTPTAAPGQPTDTPSPGSNACPSMNNGLPNSKERYTTGFNVMPNTTREVCAYSKTQYYSLPFRNKKCTATQAGINKAHERMKTFYPLYWSKTRLLDEWQTVQEYARKYNFNPLFVIALWIEESAAGGATHAQQLGCVNRLNKDDKYTFMPPSSTICEQMECLFGLWSVDPSNYARFACNYRWGMGDWTGSYCKNAINFTMTLEFWYNLMAENLSASCKIRYFPKADARCQGF